MGESFNGIIEPLDIGGGPGKLSEKTFVAKDLFDVSGHVTGAGNPDWKRTHAPAPTNAIAIQRLLNAGAHLIGKSCTDELAHSLIGINVHFGMPVNPNLPGHIPGGSSSGSASAVAASLCDFAIGTDTGGSIRVPSAYCGIFGFRPTHGRIPVSGVFPLASSFDTVGWMARSPEMLAKVGKVLLAETEKLDEMPPKILLISECLQLLHEDLQDLFEIAMERSLNLKQVEAFPLPKNSLEDWASHRTAMADYEVWCQHGEWMQVTNPNMGESMKKNMLDCALVSRTEYDHASGEREKMCNWMNSHLQEKVLCIPAVWNWAPIGTAPAEVIEKNNKMNGFLNSIASFGGLPQIVIPITIPGVSSKFAISFIAGAGRDSTLLALAQHLCR